MSRVTDLVVRPAVLDDAAAMAALLGPIVEARCYTAMTAPVTLASQRAWIESFPARGVSLVAVETAVALPAGSSGGDDESGRFAGAFDVRGAQGRLVGMQDVVPHRVGDRELSPVGAVSTFVALDRHRRGIATRLFAATSSAARALGYETLVALIRADNHAGLRAYRRLGFEVVDPADGHVDVDGRRIARVRAEIRLTG